MSESVNKVKEQKRRKMKLRRTRDLISQEILSQEDLASVKKSIKKVRKNKNVDKNKILPQIDDLFDSGIKTNRSKENNQSTSSTSTSEIDFKKPVVDKKVQALKTSTKVNCVGQSWLVESYTDMSSCADSAKENSFETVSLKKSFTKKKKNTGAIAKRKTNNTVLENLQLKPCYVLLDKMKHDVDDESFKFLPSNSSSPFLGRNVSNLKVLRSQSSLTKEMFEELPNWSRSDYWDVEDLIEKRKAVDGSKSVSNIRNSTYELNRPSLNGTIDLSTSKKSLKCNSTVEIEKSLQSQSFTSTTKPTVLEKEENIDVVDKFKLEDGFKLNQSLMNGTINLSVSGKSLINNSTFEIDKPLNISRRQLQRRNCSLSSEQQKIFEDVNKTTAENESKSISTVNNSTYELNRSSINGTINLSTSRKSLKNNSTFEIDKLLDFSCRQLQRSNAIRGRSSENHTPEFEDVGNKTAARDGSKSVANGDDSEVKPTTSEKRKGFCQLSRTVNNSNCLKTIDNDLETDENNCPEPPLSPCLGGNLLTDSEKRGKLKQQKSTFTTHNSLSNDEVFQLPKSERKKWVILNENEKSLSRKSLRDSLANTFNSPIPIKRRTIGESSAKLERRRSSIFNKVNKKSPVQLPASFLNQESGFISQTLDETSSSPDGESNVFIFGQKSSETPKSTEEESSFLSDQDRPGVIARRRSTLTLNDTVTDIDVLKSACDLNGSPKELEQRATKKSRCVTFKNNSVIVIEDSEPSFEKGSPIIINDSETDSFTVTSTTTPGEPRRRISSDSSLLKKSIGLNHKIRLASDDLATKNKNLAASKSKLKKMPNFAKIHQKMFDKMPDLRQYSEKKKERAKLLLSGKKIPKQPEIIAPVTKKQLFTSSASASTKSNFVSSTPNVNKNMIGYTRFGFQVAQRNATAKQEKIAAVANKRRPVDTVPRQRFKEELKGVRSNKRFELLMKMRQV